MSDQEYMDFLDKANQDVGGGSSKPSQPVSTASVNTEVPAALQKVDEYYVSDADEPFEPVALKWDGKGLPSEGRSKHHIACFMDIRKFSSCLEFGC